MIVFFNDDKIFSDEITYYYVHDVCLILGMNGSIHTWILSSDIITNLTSWHVSNVDNIYIFTQIFQNEKPT